MLNRLPQIRWGAAFANILDVASFDSAVAYSDPREGSDFTKNSAGVEEAWVTGHDQVLEGDVGWIPTSDSADPLATGWDGATGWRAFLQWAREKNQFRWIPDRTVTGTFVLCYLVDPIRGAPPIEDDGTRRIRLKIRTADDSAFAGY